MQITNRDILLHQVKKRRLIAHKAQTIQMLVILKDRKLHWVGSRPNWDYKVLNLISSRHLEAWRTLVQIITQGVTSGVSNPSIQPKEWHLTPSMESLQTYLGTQSTTQDASLHIGSVIRPNFQTSKANTRNRILLSVAKSPYCLPQQVLSPKLPIKLQRTLIRQHQNCREVCNKYTRPQSLRSLKLCVLPSTVTN